MDSDTPPKTRPASDPGLSYKFQRLRERIRAAIVSGELSGKLPGERALARQFHVNAKTLSKALTDLAAEGVLQRSIGRGTYVPSDEQPTPTASRWLLLIDSNAPANPLVTHLLRLNPESRCIAVGESIRPSLLAQYSVVVNCTGQLSGSIQRNLMVRGIPLIQTVDQDPEYSTHTVLFDRCLAAFNLGRDLLLTGHTQLYVHGPEDGALLCGLSLAAARYAPEAHIAMLADLDEVIRGKPSAIIANGAAEARQLLEDLRSRGVTPGDGRISLCAIGVREEEAPCTGYYLPADKQAAAIESITAHLQPNRLSTLWLNGEFVDRGTTTAVMLRQDESAIAPLPGLLYQPALPPGADDDW